MRHLKTKQNVSLLSILSISGLGEAADAVLVLDRIKGFIPRFHPILIQCMLVSILSVTAIMSGPIAKFSTRNGFVIRETNVPGVLATIDHTSQIGATVKWNQTVERLKRARFPSDQLLDFLPDNQVDWVYQPSQWNSSWSLSCVHTSLTQIDVAVTGKPGTTVMDEVSGIKSAFPQDVVENWSSYRRDSSWRAFYEGDYFVDVLLINSVSRSPSNSSKDYTRMEANNGTIRMVLTALHMHNVPQKTSSASKNADFGIGAVESAAYTMADCTISPNPRFPPPQESYTAYPWTNDTLRISAAMIGFYGAIFVEESIAGVNIFHPSSQDLVRLLQVYMVSKDTQYRHKAVRQMSVKIQSAEISVIAVTLLIVYCLAMVLGLLWAFFVVPYPVGMHVPRTKVEWMMHAMKEAYGYSVDAKTFSENWTRLRGEIQNAVYGITVG